jgi:hypothetical protein
MLEVEVFLSSIILLIARRTSRLLFCEDPCRLPRELVDPLATVLDIKEFFTKQQCYELFLLGGDSLCDYLSLHLGISLDAMKSSLEDLSALQQLHGLPTDQLGRFGVGALHVEPVNASNSGPVYSGSFLKHVFHDVKEGAANIAGEILRRYPARPVVEIQSSRKAIEHNEHLYIFGAAFESKEATDDYFNLGRMVAPDVRLDDVFCGALLIEDEGNWLIGGPEFRVESYIGGFLKNLQGESLRRFEYKRLR